MPLRIIPLENLLPYFRAERIHYYYEKSNYKYQSFQPHSEGTFPVDLIESRRPNEDLLVMKYRKQIWQPITKPTFSRILQSLSKIRRSQDWVITYPKNSSEFSKINEEETLEKYCEFNFPYFTSVTNWLFSVALKEYLTDPNGVIVTIPLEQQDEVLENEFVSPFPTIFSCCDVIYFDENDYAILSDPKGCYYTVKRMEKPGKAFFVVTDEYIERFVQVDDKQNFVSEGLFEHGLTFMPAFRLGGVICESSGRNYLYESRICGILPELNEAVREYSDLQASKVTNVYMERWEYTSHECSVCKGKGQVINPNWFQGCAQDIPTMLPCNNCQGGYIVAGPYSKVIVKPAETGQQPIPLPPAGYVEKDTEIVKIMEASVRNHIFYALAAINFQFLEQTPLNESGKAKEVDKDELNNTVHAIAEDLVKIMDTLYKTIAYYRYKLLYPLEKIDEMLPQIPVPEKFDLLSTLYLQEELKAAKEAKINQIIVNAMEVDYASKRFGTQKEIRDTVALSVTLDPLPNISEDEKMSKLNNKGITLEAYVISSNIYYFIQRALEEDENFYEKDLSDQQELMQKYAKEVIDANSTSKGIIKDLNGLSNNGNGQQQQNGEDGGEETPPFNQDNNNQNGNQNKNQPAQSNQPATV